MVRNYHNKVFRLGVSSYLDWVATTVFAWPTLICEHYFAVCGKCKRTMVSSAVQLTQCGNFVSYPISLVHAAWSTEPLFNQIVKRSFGLQS